MRSRRGGSAKRSSRLTRPRFMARPIAGGEEFEVDRPISTVERRDVLELVTDDGRTLYGTIISLGFDSVLVDGWRRTVR